MVAASSRSNYAVSILDGQEFCPQVLWKTQHTHDIEHAKYLDSWRTIKQRWESLKRMKIFKWFLIRHNLTQHLNGLNFLQNFQGKYDSILNLRPFICSLNKSHIITLTAHCVSLYISSCWAIAMVKFWGMSLIKCWSELINWKKYLI